MTERDDMLAMADEFDTYGKQYHGEWAMAFPSMTWCQFGLVTKALRSAARTGPDVAGFEAGRNAARMASLAQRCERGTTWDLACTTIAAAIAALPAPAGESVTVWQPIETAPKDTKIWAWGANWHWQEGNIGFLHSDYYGYSDVVCLGGRAGPPFSIGSEKAPTHWQPLPEPPTRKSEARS